jgi:hypothetical protein
MPLHAEKAIWHPLPLAPFDLIRAGPLLHKPRADGLMALRYYCVLTCIALSSFLLLRIIILLGNAAAIKAPMTGALCREKYEIKLRS